MMTSKNISSWSIRTEDFLPLMSENERGFTQIVMDVLNISGNDFSNSIVKGINETIESATAGPLSPLRTLIHNCSAICLHCNCNPLRVKAM